MAAPSRCDPDQVADGLLDFINASVTEFHAVDTARKLLGDGWTRLDERQSWEGLLKPGGRYYFTRNDSTLVAFAVGSQYQPGNGFYIVGAHTDSPCFKLKPVSKEVKSGYAMVNVEPYGGLLQHTWFDRDLSVAGRVLVRQADGHVRATLVRVPDPILRIPMLAIHLQRDINDTGFRPNKQTHCVPLLAIDVDDEAIASAAAGRHHSLLLKLLAKHVPCAPEDIVDFDLNVVDTQPGVRSGAAREFVSVGRLDNLCSSYLATRALRDSVAGGGLEAETAVRVAVLFDNEEVGSATAQGAAGPVLDDALARVAAALGAGEEGAATRALQASFLVSADMAHALHPNYPDRHDACHAPRLGAGFVLKHNANQRYATTAASATLFRAVAEAAGAPTAEFAVRSDMGCGSTIGPILASGLGLRTVDVGLPQLAMHSIREMCAVADVAAGYDVLFAFFCRASTMDRPAEIDQA